MTNVKSTRKRQMAYFDSTGALHEDLQSAVAADITFLLDAEKGVTTGVIATRILGQRLAADASLRSVLLRLLGELA